jgi:hypothetical protein
MNNDLKKAATALKLYARIGGLLYLLLINPGINQEVMICD